jgi:3-methyladenine DNA glycosylase AlkD
MSAQYIISEIEARKNPAKARWLENYIKHDLHSLGVGIPEIRDVIKLAEKEFSLSSKSLAEQEDLLNELMRQKFTEDKIAAVLYIQLLWKSSINYPILKLASRWFDDGLITDWNVCDWLCVRVLAPMIDQHPEHILPELHQWNKHQNQWKARASLASFAQCKTIDKHVQLIEKLSTVLIKREERFCKTAVGWVLREVSRKRPSFVMKFLKQHEEWVSREVIRNATKCVRKKA